MNTDSLGRVTRSFSQAAASYDRHAVIQASMVNQLDNVIASQITQTPNRIMDMGCGTGFLTQKLCTRYPAAQITAIDSSSAMLEQIPPALPVERMRCDFSNLPVEKLSIDLIASSAALQWSLNEKDTLSHWLDCLKPGGTLAIATFASRTFQEWAASWQSIEAPSSVNRILTLAELHDLPISLGYDWSYCASEEAQLYFPTPQLALNSVRHMGAGVQRSSDNDQPVRSRSDWQGFFSAYEAQRLEKGIPLTYEVFYGLIRKI